MLNVFNQIYNIIVRDVPTFYRALISAISAILSLTCVAFFLKKTNAERPVSFGYIILVILFAGISVLYCLS